MTERIKYLDSLRGLAVILMVQQHLQSWLWNKQWLSYGITFSQHPVMLSLNFLGNFSAAIFLIVAGIGSALFYDKNTVKYEVLKRGVFILLCGYLLNVISPHWFKPGSWYILHTIGIAVILSLILNRINTTGLVILSALFVISAPLIQTWLNTPLMLGNNFMNDASRNGGMLRLIFAEGHFPVFPWLGFFISGIICQRLIISDKKNRILIISVLLISAGSLFRWFYVYGFFFATGGKFFRIFVFLPYVYPPLPSFIMIVGGIAILLLYIFLILSNSTLDFFFNSFSSVGRLSLSWFFIHIMIFNEMFSLIGIKKIFNAPAALFIILITIIIIILLSLFWNKHRLKFSIEWFMRKIIKL